MIVHVVLREEGIATDGYYEETQTTILGVRENPKEASELLDAIAKKNHQNDDDKPIRGKFTIFGNTELVYVSEMDPCMEDKYWIEEVSTKQPFIKGGEN